MARAVAILRAGHKRAAEIIDTLLLDHDQRRSPTGILTSLKGTKVEIAFSKPAAVATDDCLILEDGRLIVAAWGKDIQPDFSTKEPGRLLAVDLNTKELTAIGSGEPVGNLDAIGGHAECIVARWRDASRRGVGRL